MSLVSSDLHTPFVPRMTTLDTVSDSSYVNPSPKSSIFESILSQEETESLLSAYRESRQRNERTTCKGNQNGSRRRAVFDLYKRVVPVSSELNERIVMKASDRIAPLPSCDSVIFRYLRSNRYPPVVTYVRHYS